MNIQSSIKSPHPPADWTPIARASIKSSSAGSSASATTYSTTRQKLIHQRLSSESGGSSEDVTEDETKKAAVPLVVDLAGTNAIVKPDESDSKSGKSVGSSGSSGDHGGSLTSTSQSSKSGKLSRKDSFNNWSSDEETNLMMNKMQAFFRDMVSGGGEDKTRGVTDSSGLHDQRLRSGWSRAGPIDFTA